MAITKEKLRDRVLELMDDMRPYLERKLNEVLDSGRIDFNELPDNWAPSKELFIALMREAEFQHTNIHAIKKDKARIKEYTRLVRFSGMYSKNDYNM